MSVAVHTPTCPFDLVVLAASTGGIRALRTLITALPENFPLPLIVVQHLAPRFPSSLASILERCSALPVAWASTGQRLACPGVLVAPPDQHLAIGRNHRIVLSQDPVVNFVRPSADVLFRSAATSYGERVLAVVLTGTGRDGAAGAVAIKRAGGRVLTQNAASSAAFGMPSAAIAQWCVDFVLPLETLASALITLVMAPGGASLFRVEHDPNALQPHSITAADWEASLHVRC